MTTMMMPRSIPALVLLLALGAVGAFHHPAAGVRCAPPTSSVSFTSPINPSPVVVQQEEMRRTVALASKKKGPDDKKPEKEKVSGLDLVLLYMTPWKNPNSIFVYFILIINILAKIKEMQ
jgi:acyl-coenzyme A synthetase/AMP-(fatty) acid ligase